MKRSNLSRERGFSLVELMVAITLGLVIMAAVSALFVSSRKTYTVQDSLARLQENARFAMQFMVKELRLAGYYGCISEINADSIHNNLNNSTNFAYNALIPLEGLNSGGTAWYPSADTTLPTGMAANTDAFSVRRADSDSPITLDQEMPNTSAVLKTNVITDLAVGDIIMVSDCASADIMQVTQLDASDPHIVHNSGAGTPGNSTQALSKAYSPSAGGEGTRVMKFKTTTFFIKTGASGNPALFRQVNTGAPVELVDGIERMTVRYGKDTDSDKIPNVYLRAGAAGLTTEADWTAVTSVRIGILARTLNEKDTDIDTGEYDVDGNCPSNATAGHACYDVSPQNDRYKRRVFQAVVQLRNRQ